MAYHKQFYIQIASVVIMCTSCLSTAALAVPDLSATTAALGGETRYLTHVETDKPLYRPGETVYIRAIALEAHHHTPLPSGSWVGPPQVCIFGPKGDQLTCGASNVDNSTAAFAWEVTADAAGGPHRAEVSWPASGWPPSEREFEVRAFRAPRLRQEIKLAREGYGPGDEVRGTLESERAEGGFPVGATVEVQARVDGLDIHRANTSIDATGKASFAFHLPKHMERGEGSVTLIVHDGGVVESASKTLPILLQTLDVQFFPEGGELIAGVPNRVYVEARTPWGKPADLRGQIVDRRGVEVGRLATEHEGRGQVVFEARPDEQYSLIVEEPAGIEKLFPLPSTKSSGVALRLAQEGGACTEGVPLELYSAQPRQVHVILSRIDTVLASQSVKIEPGKPSMLTLSPQGDIAGVVTATVYDQDGTPLAERLAFLQPKRALRIEVKADKARYVPGGDVALAITVTDEGGRPIATTLGVTVTDAAVADLLEKRDLPPDFLAAVLLEADVEVLEDARAYLGVDTASANALDLLLATEGWRRFAVVDTASFLGAHGDAARRVLADVQPVITDGFDLGGVGRGGGGFGMAAPVGAVAAARPANGFAPPIPAPAPPAEARPQSEPAAAVEDAPPVQDEDIRANIAVAGGEAEQQAQRRVRARGPLHEQAKMAEKREFFAEDNEMAAADRLDIHSILVPVQQYTREYAHQRRQGWRAGERTDFADTVYWAAAIATDARGQATVRFALSDAVTTFEAAVGGFSAQGALGATRLEFESVEPFCAEPKLPLEVTQGDRISLPIGVANGTATSLGPVSVEVSGPAGVQVGTPTAVSLAADSRARVFVPLIVRSSEGGAVRIATRAGDYSGVVERPLAIRPQGFPVEVATGGMLEPNTTFEWKVTIPSTLVPGSQTSRLALFASPTGNLASALERLIQEPYGCFEQTSSTTYPLVMAQQYFKSHTGVDQALVRSSNTQLAKGYERLKGFECTKRGFEWFGEDPGHEALTAYGLMEFSDMAAVYPVDAGMLNRTRSWLLGTRDGKGSFERKRRALHTWVEDKDASDAYILWALLEAGTPAAELGAEIAHVKERARTSRNTYVQAIAANVLFLANDSEGASTLASGLARAQDSQGMMGGATTSIVGSEGESLQVETTALAALAWMRSDKHRLEAERAIQGLTATCKDGRYGTTQSTVLALRAILAYDAANARPKRGGNVLVTVDGRQMGSAVHFDATAEGTIALGDIAEVLEPGVHTIRVSMTDGAPLPLSLAVRYFSTLPNSAEDAPLTLETALAAPVVEEGATSEVNVAVVNRRNEPVPFPVAIVGLPGGLEPDHESLDEQKKAGKIAAYEVRGREVILYWRDLGPKAEVNIAVRVQGGVPGRYTGPASRAYLYYGDENKHWVAGLAAEVTANE